MELSEIRREIDQINREMQELFERRMELCGQVAAYKGAHGMEIFVPAREEEILEAVRQRAVPPLSEYDVSFFRTLLALSRDYQGAILGIDLANPSAIPERFETERLLLRPLRREDLPPVFSLTSDPEVARYMRFDAHTDPSQTLDLINELNGNGNHAYLVMTRAECFAGVFALRKAEESPDTAELTIFLAKRHWNQGFCGELLRFAREKAPGMGFSKLCAWVADGNTASQKALEKAGFTVEQRLTVRGWDGGLTVYQLSLKDSSAC